MISPLPQTKTADRSHHVAYVLVPGVEVTRQTNWVPFFPKARCGRIGITFLAIRRDRRAVLVQLSGWLGHVRYPANTLSTMYTPSVFACFQRSAMLLASLPSA